MIRGFIETSLVDWDGKISSVVFFDKCNFMCPFCQNWDLIINPNKFPIIEWKYIKERLQAKKGWIDGVVLTGGEPLCNEQEAAQLCGRIKELDLLVKIDTNGAFPEVMQRLIGNKLIDYIAMDIKAPIDERYNMATGKQVDLDKIKKSMTILMGGNIDYEFRTTCVPGIIDANAIHQIGKNIKSAKKWALQAHVPDNAYKTLYQQKLSPKYHQQLKKYFEISKEYVSNTILRAKI
jgi:pyruvate formate lyase activating enzyme